MRVAVGAGFLLASLWAALSEPALRQSREALDHQIDVLFSPLTSPEDPGCAVLVKRDGEILFEKGYGVRELRSRSKNDAQSNFRLASFTKQFTALAVLLLIHDGKLQYEDRLTDIFPEFPAYGKSITIRELLTHTSGLPDYEELMRKEEKVKGPLWSAEHQIQDPEVLSLLERQGAGKFVPGTRWAYSNSGYVVLGLIVAKVSGMPYRDFLEKRIFSPLGMAHSIVYQKGINVVPDRAFGYSREGNQFVETDQSPTSATLGDSRVYSNLQDLSKWDDALDQHTLLSEKEMLAAYTPVKLADGSLPRWPAGADEEERAGQTVLYGFGWFLDPYEGHSRMYHTGSTRGFRTVIERFPGDRLTIVILANRLDLNPRALSEQIAGLLLNKPGASGEFLPR